MKGRFKLNTDGSCLRNPRRGGIGGTVHNSAGGWVSGFGKSFPSSTNNHMDLMSLKEGLQMVKDLNLILVDIKIDSLEVISMLNNGNPLYNAIVDECRSKLSRLGNPGVFHYNREKNEVVDALRNWGALKDV